MEESKEQEVQSDLIIFPRKLPPEEISEARIIDDKPSNVPESFCWHDCM